MIFIRVPKEDMNDFIEITVLIGFTLLQIQEEQRCLKYRKKTGRET